MKILCIIILLLLVYVGVVYIRFQYILAHAHLDPIVQTERNLGTGPALRYVAAGDSTAMGQGASSVEKTYAYRVAEYLGHKYSVQYKNVAVGGARTQDVIDKQIESIISFNPDIVTISIGGNDLTRLANNDRVVADFKTIIQTLSSKTQATIYITDIPNFGWADLLPGIYRQILEAKIKSINPQLLLLENDRVKIVDIHNFGWANYKDLSSTNSRDHFHPNDEGYTNWTNAFLSKIKNQY